MTKSYTYLFLTIQLIMERDRLNKDLERDHAALKTLEEEIEEMSKRK